MRGTVACIVLSLAAVGVLGGSFYGEKENALKAVNDKHKELETIITNVGKHVKDQRRKTEVETEEEVEKAVMDEGNKAMYELSGEATNVTETAMAKGKPLSVIECIVNVVLDGLNALIKAMDGILKELKKIKERKESVLTMSEVEINLMGSVVHNIKDKTLQKINNATSGFQALQADAINKMNGAQKQLEQLDAKILKIDIKSEFLALKRQIAPKLKESIAVYLKKLQQCL